MDDEIDLEDIECRLYSQVYHSNIENEENNTTSASDVTSHPDGKIHNNSRYFSKGQIPALPLFIALEEGSENNPDKVSESAASSVLFNSKSTNITTEGNLGKQYQNNITVNQYNLPLIISPELNEALSPRTTVGPLFVPWYIRNKNLLEGQARYPNRKENRRKNWETSKRNRRFAINKTCLRGYKQNNKVSHIVYISDDSDSDCVMKSGMSKKSLKSKEKQKLSNSLENLTFEIDDDIIYVPPSPVEIINIDVDNEDDGIEIVAPTIVENTSSVNPIPSIDKSNYQPSSPTATQAPEPCTCNDFLDCSAVEGGMSNFNFSLHGNDFNNTGDFVRPANPVEYCETESSCSTNDFNKDNNSVKTIVFNEVEFPKEDIFSDRNLEGFSTYITPKRNVSKESEVVPKTPKPATRVCNERETSSSSSESEYESSGNVNKNIEEIMESGKKLPTLSPMHCEKITPDTKLTKPTCNKPQATSNTRKDSGKRKSDLLDCTELVSNTNKEVSKLTTKKLQKKKAKASGKQKNYSEDAGGCVTVHLQGKTSEAGNDADIDLASNVGEGGDASVSEKRVKKKMRNFVDKVLGNEEYLKDQNYGISKRANDINVEGLELVDKDTENISDDSVNMSRRKKKRHSLSYKKTQGDGTPISSSSETSPEKGKRKKKKSISSENSGNDMDVNELNKSWVGISDLNMTDMENEITNMDNSTSVVVSSLETAPRELGEFVLPVGQIAEKSDADKTSSKHDLQNITETYIENVNKTATNSLGSTSFGALENEEIIVIDEVDSHKSVVNVKDCIEIVESSDSETDFEQLGDVGQDLELANCSVDGTPCKEFIDINNSGSHTILSNKNLFEDPSKFDFEQIQRAQSDNPENWKILPRDQLLFLNPSGNKGPRCNRCRRFGHIAVRCTEKPDPPKCTLCGGSGHQEPRCPNRMCTQCGNQGDYSTSYCWKCIKSRYTVCHVCNVRGHLAKNCPDLWRRYHLTTREGPVVVLQEPQLKPQDQLWCSGCAGQGHLEYECNYYYREYPPTNPRIASYRDVLCLVDRNISHNVFPSPPPPPVWNTQVQNNVYEHEACPNIPSTSQNIPPGTPPPLLPEMPKLDELPVPAESDQNDVEVPNSDTNCDDNAMPESTKVLNPFSVTAERGKNAPEHRVLDQMMNDYVNDGNAVRYRGRYDCESGKVIHPRMFKNVTDEYLKNVQKRIKRIIMSMPAQVVKDFLRNDVDELEAVVSKSDPKYLRKKLYKYDRITQGRKALNCDVVKERCFWYRTLNMFIFGIHHYNDGKRHISFIRKYVSEAKKNKLDSHRRKALLNSYNYIFDAHRRINLSYYNILHHLINGDS